MTTIPYSVRFDPLPDMDCEIECSIEWQHGEPVVIVDDVTIDGMSLYRHPDASKHAMFLQLALAISDRAEDDDFILDRLIEDEAVSYRGGPNNPAGHWGVAR